MRFELTLMVATLALLAAPATPAIESGQQVFLAQGNVVVTEADGSIYVALDELHSPPGTDGSIDWLFELQRPPSAAVPRDLPGRLTDAIVFFDRENLFVRGEAPGRSFLLTVAEKRSLRDLRSLFPTRGEATRGRHRVDTASATHVIEGIGLACRRGGSEIVWRNLGLARDGGTGSTTEADELPCGPDGEGGSSSSVYCWAGGCGATSCNVTCLFLDGCGISCNSGYFACCNCEFAECSCHSDDVCGC